MIRPCAFRVSGLLVSTALMVLLAPVAHAADPKSSEQLVRQLACQKGQECNRPIERKEDPELGRPRSFRAGKDGDRTRSFKFEPVSEAVGRQALDQASAGRLPSTDVEILFEYDSDVVTAAGQRQLDDLAQALADRRLAGHVFMLVGHTDAAGNPAYNQGLSERRAASVMRYLVEQRRVEAVRLETFGRGQTDLKLPANPLSAENRRVQVITKGVVATSAPR